MKKILIVLVLLGWGAFEGYAREQTWKVIYDTTTDTSDFIMVDTLNIGNDTTTYKVIIDTNGITFPDSSVQTTSPVDTKSWGISGYSFSADTTTYPIGIFPVPVGWNGDISDVYFVCQTAPIESWGDSAYSDVIATMTFTAGISTVAVTGLSKADVAAGNITQKTRYYSMAAAAFGKYAPANDDDPNLVMSIIEPGSLNLLRMAAPVHLPHGAVVTSFKVYWYRVDAAASGSADLFRHNFTDTNDTMATADSDSTAGMHSVEDTSISNATIDNSAYAYWVQVDLDANDSFSAPPDVRFQGIVITYTIEVGLP